VTVGDMGVGLLLVDAVASVVRLKGVGDTAAGAVVVGLPDALHAIVARNRALSPEIMVRRCACMLSSPPYLMGSSISWQAILLTTRNTRLSV
jgi:hypothetical protein